jgi:hypothetical protein
MNQSGVRSIEITFYRPALAANTLTRSWAGNGAENIFVSGVLGDTTAYDGFTIYVNTGSITGTVRCYAYENA